MGPGFFGPAAFGIHMPMMRGHMGMDPAGMDYMAEQFQGELLCVSLSVVSVVGFFCVICSVIWCYYFVISVHSWFLLCHLLCYMACVDVVGFFCVI